MLLWYTFSIGITFYNKWLFRVNEQALSVFSTAQGYDFDFPLTVTVIHMCITALLAGTIT